MKLRTLDSKFLANYASDKSIEIVKAQGDFLIGAKGEKYIDLVMGWCVGNIGWGNKAVKAAIRRFNGPDYVMPSFLYQPWAELAALLAKIAPGRLSKSFRATGGTEAVEIALSAASLYTGRHKFISIAGGYHGNSIGAVSIGSPKPQERQNNLWFRSQKIKPPLDSKAADKIEKLLQRQDIAALIMEPIICNLAVIMPEPLFMTRIQELCKKYGSLLIMDEVATGFGRTGKLFASEHYHVQPDIMCLAKALTGGYGALGATLMTAEVAKVMEQEGNYYSTFGWHPLSVAAALANIQFILRHWRQIEKNIQAMSEYFNERLLQMSFKYPAEIKVKGLAMGITFKQADYAGQVVERAQKAGVLLSLIDEYSFTLFPALNIEPKVAQKALDILNKCV